MSSRKASDTGYNIVPGSDIVKKRPCLRRIACHIALFVAMLSFIALFVVGPPLIDEFIDNGVNDRLVIKDEHSQGYAQFQSSLQKDNPSIYLYIYMFEITNHLEVLEGAKPYLGERGPYVYLPIEIKHNITFHNHSTITYKPWKYYTFVPELSISSDGLQNYEDDNITSLNIPFMAAAAVLKGLEGRAELETLYGESVKKGTALFTTRTAHELIWGYNDTQLEFAHKLDKGISPWYPGLQQNFTTWEEADKGNNITEIYSGEDNIHLLRAYKQWQGSEYVKGCAAASCPPHPFTNAWASSRTSRVPLASEGDQFLRNLKKGASMPVFVEQAFRGLTLNYGGETQLHGINVYKYTVDMNDFANVTASNGATEDYYAYGPSGILNISKCEHSMKAFLSKPHFLDADTSLLAPLDGEIRPNRQDHDLELWVEPIMGTTFFAHKRIQAAWYIEPIPNMGIEGKQTWFENLEPLYLPVIWFDELGELSAEQAQDWKDNIGLALTIKAGCIYVTIPCAVVCFLVFLYAQYYNYYKGLEDENAADLTEQLTYAVSVRSPSRNRDVNYEYDGYSAAGEL